MASQSMKTWLVIRVRSPGSTNRCEKTDMKISFQLERENALSVSAQKRPRREIGASRSSRDSYDRAQFNMTRLWRFFSYRSHPATDCSVSCLRIRPVGFESQGRERIELLTTHFKHTALRNRKKRFESSGVYFFTAGFLVLFHHFGRFLLTGHIEPAPYPSIDGSHNSFFRGFRVDWEAVFGVAERF